MIEFHKGGRKRRSRPSTKHTLRRTFAKRKGTLDITTIGLMTILATHTSLNLRVEKDGKYGRGTVV
jgi:hypothetical protein